MTYEEIKTCDKLYLVSTDIAPLLHVSPHRLMIQAREHPEKIPFPVLQIGKVVRFPRHAVLGYLEDVVGLGK